MIRITVISLLLATPLAAGPAAPLDSAPRPDSLSALIERPSQERITAGELAGLLLKAELGVVAVWLDELAQASRKAQRRGPIGAYLADLRVTVRQVPGVMRALVARPDLPPAARSHALSVAIDVLHAGGTPADFRELIGLVGAAGELPKRGTGEAQSSLERYVLRAASLRTFSVPDLQRLYQEAPASLTRAILDGVAGGSDSSFSAATLTRLLGLVPASDAAILNRLHLTLQKGGPDPSPTVANRVAAYLDDSRPFARHEAAACLAKIGGRDHVRPLIDRLEDRDQIVRAAAQAALHELTGMALPIVPQRWRMWLADQLDWWDTNGQSQLDQLAIVSRTEQLAILREICTKRLFHDEIAAGVAELLQDGDSATQCLALSALGTLRSPGALDLVSSFRGHSDPAVQAAAETALRSYQQALSCRGGHSGVPAR